MHSKEIEVLILPTIANIKEISEGLKVKVTGGYYSNLEFSIIDNKVTISHKGRDIKSYALVWLSSFWESRDLATAVKLYLDNHDVPNNYVEHSTSKITDSINFAIADIPCPNTYYTEGVKAGRRIKEIEKVCGYPMIMKDVKGCGGANSFLIKSRKELTERIKNRDQSKKYLFQQFISNDYDWGIMVSNDRVVSGERSYPKDGEYRNNSAVGATEVFVDVNSIPQDVKDIALIACRSLNLTWSRADILVDKVTGVPYLLEVNRFPGITSKSAEVISAREFLNNRLEINNLKKIGDDIIIPVAKLGITTSI